MLNTVTPGEANYGKPRFVNQGWGVPGADGFPGNSFTPRGRRDSPGENFFE